MTITGSSGLQDKIVLGMPMIMLSIQRLLLIISPYADYFWISMVTKLGMASRLLLLPKLIYTGISSIHLYLFFFITLENTFWRQL
jgi:hypothetical protein